MKTTNFKALALSTVSALIVGGAANADQVFNDDVIITQSLCVGNDCVNGESFGFDTIRMKENNTRLQFLDTSNSASFPQNDWRIIANDSGNGGSNYLAIEDSTAGRIPFRVEAGARVNALFVDSAGEVGLGTSTPVVDLHVVDGNTPTLRLDQDGSDGFTPQVWDLAGNETNFFVRDASNGSKLPFKIKPNAPTDAFFIAASGDIGMNTTSPSGSLHIKRNTGAAVGMLRMENNETVFLTLADTSATGETWNIQSQNGEVRFTNATGPGVEMAMTPTGDMTISGSLTTAGSCSVGCDAVFTEEYEIMPIAERAELMWANGYLPNVGPTAEDGPFNVSDKMGRMLNELEHAHIYIAQLNDQVGALEARLDALED